MALEVLLMPGVVGGAGDPERSRRRAVRRRIRETVAVRRACAAVGAHQPDTAESQAELPVGAGLP